MIIEGYSAHKGRFLEDLYLTSTPVKSEKKLTTSQRKAIELVSKGYSNAMVANALEVTTATIYNWKRLPLFKQELAVAINLKAESSNYKLHDLFRKALEECEGLMQDRNPTIRLGAARLVCESYSAIAKAAEEKEMLIRMEERMEQLQANIDTAIPILEAEDAEFTQLPPADE